MSIASRRISLVAAVAADSATNSPIWEPVQRGPGLPLTTSEVIHATRPPEALPAELEPQILATLTRPLHPHESHHVGNNNREQELRGAFAQLTPNQAFHLRRRLDLDRDSDALAVAFRRLVVDRRQRLRAFLADPRQRAA